MMLVSVVLVAAFASAVTGLEYKEINTGAEWLKVEAGPSAVLLQCRDGGCCPRALKCCYSNLYCCYGKSIWPLWHC